MRSKKHRDATLAALIRTRNRAMRELLDTASKLVDRDVNILILGESGVGKDFLAEAIHACGLRRDRPFVHVDSASIPHELFESELFGYEKGTFTDAQSRKIGKLEAAAAGTVYLDEVAALTPPLQAKLLRAIEERRFTRLGGNQPVAFAARVISSSNADLEALLEAGEFRRDLLYRINVVTISLPPLRERREDIQPLALAFLRRISRNDVRQFDRDSMELLESYSWPGNIRELRNVVERASLLEEGREITARSLPEALRSAPALVAAATQQSWSLDALESHYIREILRTTRSNYSRAAEILGINRKTLLEKRKKYGIE